MKNKSQEKNLISFRNSLNMTALELSGKVGSNSGQWSHYENGRIAPKLNTFLRMKAIAKNNGIDFNESLFAKQEIQSQPSSKRVSSLKELREELKLSQPQMASELGLTLRTYGRYERSDTDILITTYLEIKNYALSKGIDLNIEYEDREPVYREPSPSLPIRLEMKLLRS